MTSAQAFLEDAGGELLGPCTRHDDGAWGNDAAMLDRLGTRDVDHGHGRRERDVGGERSLAPTITPSVEMQQKLSNERPVLDDHRTRLQRLEHTAYANAAGEMDVGADLCAGADRRRRVDHVRGPTQAPMLT